MNALLERNQNTKPQSNWSAEPSRLAPGGLADILARQQLQILQGVVTKEPVQFLNTDGQTEQLSFERDNRTKRFTIRTADGDKLVVTSHLSERDTDHAFCRLTDIYTRWPKLFRFALRKIELRDTNGTTSYNELEAKLKISGGLSAINEKQFESVLL